MSSLRALGRLLAAMSLLELRAARLEVAAAIRRHAAVEVDGTTYATQALAARALGVSPQSLSRTLARRSAGGTGRAGRPKQAE